MGNWSSKSISNFTIKDINKSVQSNIDINTSTIVHDKNDSPKFGVMDKKFDLMSLVDLIFE